MTCFTIRVSDKNVTGNPGARFFLDVNYNIINHVVLFESTPIFIAEKNIESLLKEVLQESTMVEKDFFNKKHQRKFKWHVDKQKYNIKNSLSELQLPFKIKNIKGEYFLKTVGIAISEQQDRYGINGNIVILYTENNKNYPTKDYAVCTQDELVNEVELNLHIKIVEESIENYRGGSIRQLFKHCRIFKEAVQNHSFFTQALSFAQNFNNKNMNLQTSYFVSGGMAEYQEYFLFHTKQMQLIVTTTTLNKPRDTLTQFNNKTLKDQEHEQNYTQPKENEWQIKKTTKRKNIHHSHLYS